MKNKAPAEVQITAEQLLREAKERELELLPPPPQQKITDEEELNDYKLRKRKASKHHAYRMLNIWFYLFELVSQNLLMCNNLLKHAVTLKNPFPPWLKSGCLMLTIQYIAS